LPGLVIEPRRPSVEGRHLTSGSEARAANKKIVTGTMAHAIHGRIVIITMMPVTPQPNPIIKIDIASVRV